MADKNRTSKDLGYEYADFQPKVVMIGAMLLICLCVGACVFLAGFFKFVQLGVASSLSRGYEKSPLQIEAQSAPADEVSFPKIQQDPVKELAQLRAEQNAKLEAYGWVNEETQTAQVPVTIALEHVVRNGVPVFKAPEPEPEQ